MRVYWDESGIDSCLHREYAYAPRGEKAYGTVAGKRYQRENLIAAKRGDQIIAPMQYDGTTDAALVEYWFERQLLPLPPDGAVVILDNAAFHRGEKLREIIANHRRDVRILFLPPYSPELNPIEKVWAIIKHWLKMNIHRFNSLDDAISAAFASLF